MINALRRGRAAFSLVEMVLAVGIISFCLLAIIGLFSVGHLASRHATDDTSLAAATFQVISKIRSQASPTFPTNYYFDLHGQAVTNVTNAAYACDISSASVPGAELPDISTNLLRVKVQFTWPAVVSVNRPYTNTFYATLSRP